MSWREAGAWRSWSCVLLAVLAWAVIGCDSKGDARSKPGATKAGTAKPGVTKADAPTTATAKAPAGDACQAICRQAKKIGHVACVEGQLEELEFDMDSEACNEWENVVAMGGDSCAQFAACQKAEKFTVEHCRKVKAACFK